MKIGRRQKLGRAVHWLNNRFVGKGTILLYHRVTDLPADPQLLCVTPRRFLEHLEILRKHATPMNLKQFVSGVGHGNISKYPVVVTFDDGYADNLHYAKSLLERYEIPATVFVTSGYVGNDREFWWDELERLLLQPGTLPESLCLTVNGNSWRWELGLACQYSEADYHSNRCWNVLDKKNPTERHHVYRSLCQLLRPLREVERGKVLSEILLWARAEPQGRRTHRALLPDEVVRLHEGGLIEVGAHTVTHALLSTLPAEEQWAEIQGSKISLEEILSCPVGSFAYPYGARSDYADETVRLVQNAGFDLACANFPGAIRRATDSFQLPRMLIRNWDGDEFARHLKGCVGG